MDVIHRLTTMGSAPTPPRPRRRRRRSLALPQLQEHQQPPRSSFIHKAIMPDSEFPLDHVLTTFSPGISHWKSPTDWLCSDANHIETIVKGISVLMETNDIQDANFSGTMIYQRLIIYTYLHLTHCVIHQSFLDDFKQTLQRWRAWRGFTVIENHQLIRDYLIDLYQRVLQECLFVRSLLVFI